MVKTTLQADHTAVTLFQAAFGGRGKVCKRRAQRGCTAYGCGCHQLCGEVNSKCRRAADAPFLGFQAAFGGCGKFVGWAFMPDKHKPVYLLDTPQLKTSGINARPT